MLYGVIDTRSRPPEYVWNSYTCMVGVFATGAADDLRGRSWLGRTLREVRARVEVETGAAGTKAISFILGGLQIECWGGRPLW